MYLFITDSNGVVRQTNFQFQENFFFISVIKKSVLFFSDLFSEPKFEEMDIRCKYHRDSLWCPILSVWPGTVCLCCEHWKHTVFYKSLQYCGRGPRTGFWGLHMSPLLTSSAITPTSLSPFTYHQHSTKKGPHEGILSSYPSQ